MSPTSSEGGELLLKCTKCGPKPVANFTRCFNNTRGYQYVCRVCRRAQLNAYRKTSRKSAAAERAASRPIIALPDTHFPFHSEPWYLWMLDVVAAIQPSLVIQMGDLYDQFCFSRFARSHNIMTPQMEIVEGRSCAERMWKDIRSACQTAQLVQLKGNHDDRIYRRVADHLPEIEGLVTPTINALFHFDGVKTVDESREEFLHKGMLFHHGHLKFGAHVQFNNMCTVNGHLHVGGVLYKNTLDGLIWELNTGFAGEKAAPVFTYGAQKRMLPFTLGLGLIDEYGPRFIPLKERR